MAAIEAEKGEQARIAAVKAAAKKQAAKALKAKNHAAVPAAEEGAHHISKKSFARHTES